MTARFGLTAVLVCAVVTGSACSKSDNEGETSSTERPPGQLSGDGPSVTAKDDRIPAVTGSAIGPQPGHIEGAFAHANIEVQALHEFLRSLPLNRDGNELVSDLRTHLGLDMLRPDLAASLGIAEGAHLSMSARLVSTWEPELRKALAQTSPALLELQNRAAPDAQPDFKEDSTKAPPPPPADQPPDFPVGPIDSVPVEPIEPPPPPPLSPAAINLERKAKSLGLHLRGYLPVADMSKLRHLVQLALGEQPNDRWAETCASLGPVLACNGQSDGAFVLRERPGGLQIDMLLTYVSDYEQPDDSFRHALLTEALAVPAATPASVAKLRGQANMSLSGPGVVDTMRAMSLAYTFTAIIRGDTSWAERHRAESEAYAALHATQRMFEGIEVEAELGPERLVMNGNWITTPYGHEQMREVFELSEIDADVPSIASLCEGALICGRSRGFPARERFAPLATGVYANPDALEPILDRFEETSAALLLLETWPNAIGTLNRLPGNRVGPGEMMIVNSAIAMASRVLGFGFSVRSLDDAGRDLRGDWVGYARLSAADLATLTGLFQLADLRLAPTSIPEVNARIEFISIPDRDVPGNFYALTEPGAWGWAVLADADDRVRWLADRPHDDGAVPLIYAEIGDLWRLASSFREGREELGFAQAWLAQRWVRAQVGLEDGAPQLRFSMGKG